MKEESIIWKLKVLFSRYFEITVWISALILLAIMSPTDSHTSLCFFKQTGLPFCPGCGLGHSISWIFHGEFVKSFNAHPLGLFAVVVLIYRVIYLIRKPNALINHNPIKS